jgi:hypothetical protein
MSLQNYMKAKTEIREKKSTDQSIEFLSELTGITNRSQLIERCVSSMAILGKLNENLFFELFPYTTLYRREELYSMCSNVVENTIQDSSYTTQLKKKEEIAEIPNKKEESYQQDSNININSDIVIWLECFGSDFVDQWNVWKQYAFEKYQRRYRSVEEVATLKLLHVQTQGDAAEAIKAIHQSIASGYKNIYYNGKERNRTGGKGKPSVNYSAEAARAAYNQVFGDNDE